MKLGIFTANYLDKPLDEVCKFVAEMGFEAVELLSLIHI